MAVERDAGKNFPLTDLASFNISTIPLSRLAQFDRMVWTGSRDSMIQTISMLNSKSAMPAKQTKDDPEQLR